MSTNRHFVVVTGLSGSGKSQAIKALEDLGYFCVDNRDSKPGAPVFNRTVTLRDSWAKIESRSSGLDRKDTPTVLAS